VFRIVRCSLRNRRPCSFVSRLELVPVIAGLLGLMLLALPSSAASVGRGPGVGRAAMGSAAPAAGDLWPTFGHDAAHSGLSSDASITASAASGLTKRWSASLGNIAEASPAVAYSATLDETIAYDVTQTGVASAFNASTGALVWHHSVGEMVESSPSVYNGTVYFGTASGTLEALNASTGAVECTFTLPVVAPAPGPGRLISSPVVGDVDGSGPTVFIGDAGTGGTNEGLNGGHFWAITGVGNTVGGCRQKWVYDNWSDKGTGTQTGVWDEPALAQNTHGQWEVVFGTSNPDQSVYALNAVSGSRLWRFHTENNGADEDVGAGPTIGLPSANGFADGVVYIDGKDGIEYALDLLTGKKIWQFTLGAGSADTDGIAEAALSGNTLVVCYANKLFALKARTGAVIWKTTAGARIVASPAVSGPSRHQVVFVGELNGTEHGLKLQNGVQVFTAATTGKLKASATVADGMLYFTNSGKFYAYAPP